jgi:hypothetical protein
LWQGISPATILLNTVAMMRKWVS